MQAELYEDPEAFRVAIHAALSAWHTAGGLPETFLTGLWLVRERRTLSSSDNNPTTLRRTANEVLMTGIEELATYDSQGANVLKARFLNAQKGQEVASRINVSRDSVNRLQHSAISRLTEILWGHELAAREKRLAGIESRLPPPAYTQLFGVEQIQVQLIQRLSKSEAPWVAAIAGIGGIGKTALADAVVRQIIHKLRYERVIWLRHDPWWIREEHSEPSLTVETLMVKLADALWPQQPSGVPNERVERIKYTLKEAPHLIVIDNLETEGDTAALLEQLANLSTPSKFLLTTRTRPPRQSAAFVVPLDELPFNATIALFQHYAEERGLTDLQNMSQEEMSAVYRVVGGNPLAIRLVVSLAEIHSLSHVLTDLERSPHGEIEELYRRIYWQAWRSLSVDGRTLLRVMPLIADPGALFDQLKAVSLLNDAQLSFAISELATRSLLEVRGNARERRYGIHHLTDSFLRTEIIHWPGYDVDT